MKGFPEGSETEGRGLAGRPRGSWLDAVDRDAKGMWKCGNWIRSAENTDAWRRRIEEAKVKVGM
jgi:hypothetical protein